MSGGIRWPPTEHAVTVHGRRLMRRGRFAEQRLGHHRAECADDAASGTAAALRPDRWVDTAIRSVRKTSLLLGRSIAGTDSNATIEEVGGVSESEIGEDLRRMFARPRGRPLHTARGLGEAGGRCRLQDAPYLDQ